MKTPFLLVGSLLLSSCKDAERPKVRNDMAPIERRIRIPLGAESVRWIAVPLVQNTSSLPAPESPYTIYGYFSGNFPDRDEAGPLVRGTIPKEWAEAVFPPEILQDFSPFEEGYGVVGKKIDSLGRNSSQEASVSWAIQEKGKIIFEVYCP